MGSDGFPFFLGRFRIIFQSTPPAWGATMGYSVYAEKDGISIHAPRMGSDNDKRFRFCSAKCEFQSTLPAWGATNRGSRFSSSHKISIHAPRMGSDKSHGVRHWLLRYFNPRSPHGERPKNTSITCRWSRFQSTLPAWGATMGYSVYAEKDGISIHAPRMGSD